MRISKKILAAVLAALMVIAMMPFTAFAETVEVNDADSLEAAVASANAGDTVKLTGDVVATEPIVIPEGADIKIDLNGYNIYGAINGKLITNNGTVELVGEGNIYNTNVSAQGHDAFLNNGTVIVKESVRFGDADDDMTNDNDINRGAGLRNYGTAIINGGYFTAIDGISKGYAYALINDNGGTMTINDATVYGKNNGNVANNEGTVNINGGTFTLSKKASEKSRNGYNVYAWGEETVTNVNGGTYSSTNNTAAICVDTYTNAEMNISGGSFTVNEASVFKKTGVSDPAVTITGGTFNKDVTAYLAESAVQENGTVVQAYVAKVGSTKYATLEDAIAAASEGDTITLLADVDLTAYPAKGMHRIDISDKTIDLNGYTITASGRWGVLFEGTNATIKNGTMEAIDNSDAPGYQYGVYVWGQDGTNEMPDPAKKAQVTLEDLTINYGIHTYNAKVTVKNCNVTGSTKYYAVWADIDSDVTIESGNFTTGGAAVVGTAHYHNAYFGHLSIKGGNFTVPAGKKLIATGSAATSSNSGAYAQNTIISGGTYNVDPSANVADDYTVNGPVDGWYTVCPKAVDTMSITVEDDIDLNIYLDDSNASEDYNKIKTIEYTYNKTPDLEQYTPETVTVPATRNADSKVVLNIELAPGQIRDEIRIVAYSEVGEVRDFTTSIAEYCDTIIEGNYPNDLKDLAKSTLDYGKGASRYFGYNTEAYNGYALQLADPTAQINAIAQAAANNTLGENIPFTITGVSYRATSKPEIRFYIDPSTTSEDLLEGYNKTVVSTIGTAYFAKHDDDYLLIVKDIDITNFGKQFTVTIKDSFDPLYDVDVVSFTPITWVNAALGSEDEDLEFLARTIGNYYLKSVNYFGA